MHVESNLQVYEMNGCDLRTDLSLPVVTIESTGRQDEVVISVPSEPPTKYTVIASQLKKAIENAINTSSRISDTAPG